MKKGKEKTALKHKIAFLIT